MPETKQGKVDLLSHRIEAGASVDLPFLNSVTSADTSLSGMTSLMIADTDGHEEAVRLPVGASAGLAHEVPDKMPSGKSENAKMASLTAMKCARRGNHRNIAELLGDADRNP